MSFEAIGRNTDPMERGRGAPHGDGGSEERVGARVRGGWSALARPVFPSFLCLSYKTPYAREGLPQEIKLSQRLVRERQHICRPWDGDGNGSGLLLEVLGGEGGV